MPSKIVWVHSTTVISVSVLVWKLKVDLLIKIGLNSPADLLSLILLEAVVV